MPSTPAALADDTLHDDDDATPVGVDYALAPHDNDDTVVSSTMSDSELENMFAAAAAAGTSEAAPLKSTLVGLGSKPPVSFPESVVVQRGERDVTTEPMSVIDEANTPEGMRRSVLHGALPLSASTRLDARRRLMYASAALVGLAILGVGASALFSGGDEGAQTAIEAPSPPPTAPAVASAEGAKEPTTEPIAERATQAPAPTAKDAPAEASPQRESTGSEAPAAAPEASPPTPRSARPNTPPAAKHRVREAKPTKSAPAKPVQDTAAAFAAAREEARVHYAAKRYKQAAAAYEQATKYDPGHPGTFAGLGAARLQLGDHQGAIQAYQRAAQLAPDSAGFQTALGRAYVAGGDKSRARAAYNRALVLDPKNEAAKSALKDLGR